MTQKNKKAVVEFSFAWLFAIIIGAAILFVALFAVGKIIKQGQGQGDVVTARQIGILLNPLESSFTTATTTSFKLPLETRIYNDCDSFDGEFGKELIRVSQKSLNKWSESDSPVAVRNKYIFSENPIEGEKFYLFSKPLEMPFKVADLIYLTSDSRTYCFSDLPADSELRLDIETLNSSNPRLQTQNCPEDSIKVCFSYSEDCEVSVIGFDQFDEGGSSGYVEKNGEQMDYSGTALMMAAIFSEKEIYDCQVKRLTKRASSLAQLYSDKTKVISKTGCGTNFGSELSSFAQLTANFGEQSSIINIMQQAKDLEEKNSVLGGCKLW